MLPTYTKHRGRTIPSWRPPLDILKETAKIANDAAGTVGNALKAAGTTVVKGYNTVRHAAIRLHVKGKAIVGRLFETEFHVHW